MAALTRPIFLLSDFGTRDTYAGQLRAVIATIAPGAPVFDLTHGVEPFAIDEGAWLLETALPALPANAVVLAVVDPGVGGERRAICVTMGGLAFVGPDNGLLSAALRDRESERAAIHELTAPQYQRQPVSPTFHGRDIFAPAAAHLANGLAPALLGAPVASALTLPSFEATTGSHGELHARVIHIDRFGNLITTVRAPQLFPSFALTVGETTVLWRVDTYVSAVGDAPFCHVDSSGFIAIACNGASAAERLGVRRGDPVLVRRR